MDHCWPLGLQIDDRENWHSPSIQQGIGLGRAVTSFIAILVAQCQASKPIFIPLSLVTFRGGVETKLRSPVQEM